VSNDLLVKTIWARNGAVAVATGELAGAYVSTAVPTFALDPDRIGHHWMRLVTTWPGFWAACDVMGRGRRGKNRIKPSQFLSIRIPVPSLEEQARIIGRFDTLSETSRQISGHLDDGERDAEHLLALRFRDAIAGAPLLPMSEIAPLVRR